LNAYHRKSIGAAFHHIDERLAQIEAILHSIGAKSPFSRYAFDVGPMECHAVVGYLQRLRERMWAAMERLEIPPESHKLSAAWVICTTLLDVSITLCEIEPRRLVGYGEVDEVSATVLSGILSDLDRLVNSLDAYLRRMMGGDMAERMARLETTPANRASLARIDEIIARHGLVELRSLVEAVVSRIESRDLEIAVFGRVSSGKSSLLNYLLGHPVLPVGVLPVTAVLTRLHRSDEPSVVVRTDVSQPRRIPIAEIAEYVSEEGNPGNTRRVIDVIIGLPSERLEKGVTLIDTPGIGSLATVGAAQTKAYLPRCDLGVVLIDAGSTLDHEDLALLQALYEAAVPSMVLVSKCDLLLEADRNRVVDYIKRQTRESFGHAVSVHLTSTRDPDAALTDSWFEACIKPIMAHHQEELERSVRRKISNLAELALSLLDVRSARTRAGPAGAASDHRAARDVLRQTEERTAAVAAYLTKPVEETVSDTVRSIMHQAATEIVARRRNGISSDGVLKSRLLVEMAEAAAETRKKLEETDLFLNDAARDLAAALSAALPQIVRDPRFALTALPPADEDVLRQLEDAKCSRLLSLWPRVAIRIVLQRLRSRHEASIWSLVRDHRRSLQRWTGKSLRQITNAFEARISPLRARLDSLQAIEHSSLAAPQLESDAACLREILGKPSREPQPGQPADTAEGLRMTDALNGGRDPHHQGTPGSCPPRSVVRL
jgi:GTP-binding protein EngB required for normal cell division